MYSTKYKLKKLDELKQNERFLPYVKQLQEQWREGNVPIDEFMLRHFEGIVDNFELMEFLTNEDDDTINEVLSDAIKDLDKIFN